MIYEKLLGEDNGYMASHLLAGVGALNWGLIGVTALAGMEPINLVEVSLGWMPLLENGVYALVGLAGIDVLADGMME